MANLNSGPSDNNDHGMGDLNSKHVPLAVLEAGKSEIKMPADPVFGEGRFLVCGHLPSLCPHTAERKQAVLGLFL